MAIKAAEENQLDSQNFSSVFCLIIPRFLKRNTRVVVKAKSKKRAVKAAEENQLDSQNFSSVFCLIIPRFLKSNTRVVVKAKSKSFFYSL